MFEILDGVAIAFILLWGYQGFKNGLIEELGRLLGLIAAILISISRSSELSLKLTDYIQIEYWLSIFLSFSILFISVIFISRLFTKLIKIAFLSKGNQMMNRSLGLFFGALKGGGMMIVLVWIIAILPLEKWTTFINQNSHLAIIGNKLRISTVSFFNWEDPVMVSESYIKELTKP
jgi:membrane protein required for colicin V production